MKKKILIFSVIFAIVFGSLTLTAKTKMQAYFSGDAINYNGTLIVASTNSESLEIFKLTEDGLVKFISMKDYDGRFARYNSFNDLKLNEEGGKLYVYTISEFSLYKYDISNLNTATLVKKQTNGYWEWYTRVDKFGSTIATISNKGVKVWNANMDVIDSYDIKNDAPYNIRGESANNQFIFNLDKTEIKIFDRLSRTYISSIQLDYRNALGNRSVYYDNNDGSLYVVDDNSAKKFNVKSGALVAHFDHTGDLGYDIDSAGDEYVYFSDGIGIVKLDKLSMQPVDWKYTGGIAGSEGWAMGLKAVGNKVVVFNNANILVFDDGLNLLGANYASEVPDQPQIKESLYLRLDKITANQGAEVTLSGGGFYPNENLTINFQSTTYAATADNYGRFEKKILVPEMRATNSVNYNYGPNPVPSQATDIKVIGEDSTLSYSIAFTIMGMPIN